MNSLLSDNNIDDNNESVLESTSELNKEKESVSTSTEAIVIHEETRQVSTGTY